MAAVSRIFRAGTGIGSSFNQFVFTQVFKFVKSKGLRNVLIPKIGLPVVSLGNGPVIPSPSGVALKSLMRRLRGSRQGSELDLMGEVQNLSDVRSALQEQIPDASMDQIEVIASVQHLTMTSPERILALTNAVEYLAGNQIRGDVVECGVWRGGSMSAVAQTLLKHDDLRRLWLYDTFEGMSEPTEDDVDLRGHAAHQLMSEQDRNDAMSVWCCSPMEQVKQTMTDSGYPTDLVNYVEGKVETTLLQTTPDKIALLRLDTDWYESTRCELEHLFPKLVPGGVIIIDDYGHWKGCRRAVDEYFERNRIKMLLNRIDYTGRIGVRAQA